MNRFSDNIFIGVLYFVHNMLSKEVILKINNFVAQKPRTIQEISELLEINWRTAESYVNQISEEQGTVAMRTFRGGTKGALKIVYWNQISKNQSTFQEALFQRIISAKHKDEFSPFDIYQYIDDERRASFLEKQEDNLNIKQDLLSTLSSAKEQVFIFSGDLSWATAKQGSVPLFTAFENLASRKIQVKILARIDLNALKNVNSILSLNHKYGKELIEIKHCTQPLRAFVIDDALARFKEKYFLKSSSEENYLFYSITDEDWVQWLQKVFWHFFSTSLSAEKRLRDLKTIKEYKE